MRANQSDWWVLSRPNPGAALRVFCLPYAGASASIYRSWHTALPAEVEVFGVQLPGRSNRYSEPPFTRVKDLVDSLVPALVPLLDRPFVFFGHSMGAIASFEAARWLRRYRERVPDHLFVSGRRAPQIPDTSPPMHLMNDEEIIAKISELNGTPRSILNNAEMRQMILPVIRADAAICETYKYVDDAALPCPITAFCGLEDREETPELSKEWRVQTTSVFTLHELKGDHFFIHSNERKLLRLLGQDLNTHFVSCLASAHSQR